MVTRLHGSRALALPPRAGGAPPTPGPEVRAGGLPDLHRLRGGPCSLWGVWAHGTEAGVLDLQRFQGNGRASLQ